MLLISHRGNLYGPNSARENAPDYIDHAIDKKYHVEVDLWKFGEHVLLGHDYGQYEISLDWLGQRQEHLWIHCKNVQALELMTKTTLNYFWHNNDDYTMTSKGFIWAYPGKQKVGRTCILVMPDSIWTKEYVTKEKPFGICSDFVGNYK
jgi:hypothetical protein